MMKRWRYLTTLILLGMLTAACLGPKPQATAHTLQPPDQPGDPWIMYVKVQNTSRGEGEVAVQATLLDPQSGTALAKGEQLVELDGHETVQVAVELRPQGDGPFDQQVDVIYPP